jgi:hypothetical protein
MSYNITTSLYGKTTFHKQRDYIGPGTIPTGLIGEILDGGGGGGGNVKRFDVTNADLTNYSVVLNHRLKKYSIVEVYDNNDNVIIPNEVYAVDADNVRVNFSGIAPLSGTYHVVVAG